MKQRKKIFTKMLLNNWGGIDHQILYFHEYVNLFSGKSGSGKSTVMDALQVVLYGSIRNDFLNKAADDTRNKRSVLSYLRGEQKDGTANRGQQDFCSQIVLEIQDTGSQEKVCLGTLFEVAKGDQEVNKCWFFSHTGELPMDAYLSDKGIPYTYKKLQSLIQERSREKSGSARGNLNRIYPTQEAYLNAVNDVIFGYIDAGRFKVMEKSAIALRMTNGTGQFIKDYMFPRSKEDTIAAISDQLAAYREIKEQVEELEQEIHLLEEVRHHDCALKQAREGQTEAESALRILEIEDKKAHLSAKEEELRDVLKRLKAFENREEELKSKLEGRRQELANTQAELIASDFGRKKERRGQLEETLQLCSYEAADWQALAKRLRQWDDTEGVSEYINNSVRNLLEEVWSGTITEENTEKLKQGLEASYGSIQDEIHELEEELRNVTKGYQEKSEILEDLRKDKKHYRKELKEVRRKIKEALSDRYGRTIHVEILADLFDITDEEWRNAIEGRMGRMKFGLVVDPRYALEAAEIFRKIRRKEYESVDFINTDAIVKDAPRALPGTLYDAVNTEIPFVDFCLKRYLGNIRKCSSVQELQQVQQGVTKDCYSYSNYMFRHLREQDYRYQSIGRKISLKQLQRLEDETYKLNEQMISLEQNLSVLRQADGFERLKNYEYDKLSRLSNAAFRMEKYQQELDRLQKEICELEEGTLTAGLKEQERILKAEVEKLEEERERLQKDSLYWSSIKGELDKELQERRAALEKLQQGFMPEQTLLEQVSKVINQGQVSRYKKEQTEQLERLLEAEAAEEAARGSARMQFIKAFPSYDFSGMEKENTRYDELLKSCRNNFEPKYKVEFEKQYGLIYRMLRENVIAAIHGEIKAAKRHRRDINNMLAKIRFSDSIYQIDILPTEDENQQFYEMLTAPELDTKGMDHSMEGQISLGEDVFYQKYEQQIRRLTEKFMPPRQSDPASRAGHRKDMAKYADYRTYLKFSMYEQAVDETGTIRKNYVDDMAGRDSGGEGQNPKYVALFAGFAMLYMQQGSPEPKIRLVMLDEAFSKMDKERSEVCLRYARQLDLQLIVCVPDERLPSLVRNVDCVYAFCRKNNRISMIHIDKGQYIEMMEGM